MTNREFFIQHCTTEFPRFLSLLQATPAGKLDYRPHPKSRSAEELIGHLIGHEQDLVELAETGTINHRMQVPFKTLEDGIKLYQQAHAALETALGKMDDKTWESKGEFKIDGKTMYEYPRRDLAWLMLFDGVHHRGQLSTYIRPMGGQVPGIYGPSADSMPSST